MARLNGKKVLFSPQVVLDDDDKYVKKAAISASRKIPYFSTTEDGSYFTATGGDGSTAPTASDVVPVMTLGKISVDTPTGDYHAANKKYVNDGFVAKLIGTSATYGVYAFDDTGDTSLPVLNGTSAGTAEPISSNAIVRCTNGRIRVATPIGPYHAATKKYVDDNFFAKAVATPSLSTYQDINGYTWQALYTAMQAADTANAPLYLSNADRWLYFGTSQTDSICSQFIPYVYDEILGNKFYFVLKYVKENAGIQEIQCSITSSGVITATQS